MSVGEKNKKKKERGGDARSEGTQQVSVLGQKVNVLAYDMFRKSQV